MHIGKKILHTGGFYNVVLAIGRHQTNAPIIITGVIDGDRTDMSLGDRYTDFLKLPHLRIDKSISRNEFLTLHIKHRFTSISWDYTKYFKPVPFKRLTIDILPSTYQ